MIRVVIDATASTPEGQARRAESWPTDFGMGKSRYDRTVAVWLGVRRGETIVWCRDPGDVARMVHRATGSQKYSCSLDNHTGPLGDSSGVWSAAKRNAAATGLAQSSQESLRLK